MHCYCHNGFKKISQLIKILIYKLQISFNPILFAANEQSDHSIEEGLMDVIWARGQELGHYNHNPKTGVDTGEASVLDFYRSDELKYHGHGSQRGKVTMNFFGINQLNILIV